MSSDVNDIHTDYEANLSLWLNCNLKCPYCFGNPSPPPKNWPQDLDPRLDRLIAFLNATGRWKLTMSGGEVTIYPGFSDLCCKLHTGGHRVEFFTNGIQPLSNFFNDHTIQCVSRVAMSYQLGTEKVAKWDRTFDENISYLLKHNIDVDVNYVLYPDRRDEPQKVKERFVKQGAAFRFLAFQGEYEKQQYPFAYTKKEKAEFSRFGDIRAAFLMEHGYHLPTLKKCRAGYQTFNISLRTGGIYICEQLQQKPLALFTDDNGPQTFKKNVLSRPIICPARRCSCRLTVDQEIFLEKHGMWDMSVYSQWEKLSLPLSEAITYWDKKDQAFADEIANRLTGNGVYIWGGGVHTLNLLRQLQQRQFPLHTLQAIIDSNTLKNGQEILGFPIISADYFKSKCARKCTDIIISTRSFEEEIAGVIKATYGDRFNVIRLYDGSLINMFETLSDGWDVIG